MICCRKIVGVALLATLGAAWFLPIAAQQDNASSDASDYPQWSAFSAVAWKDDLPQVEFEGAWYELVSFHGIPSEDIVRFCQENYGRHWQMSFAENLVGVVRHMGLEISRTTQLVLRQGNKVRTVGNVHMTEETWWANYYNLLKDPFSPLAPGYSPWSAFSAVAWRDDVPHVKFEGAWNELLSFHGIPSEDIVRFCQEECGRPWQARFAMDLVGVVRLMGHQIGRTTQLVLRQGDRVRTVDNVRMTDENRRMTRGNWRAIMPDRLQTPVEQRTLPMQAVNEDLDLFQKALVERFAYFKANDTAYLEAIDAIDALRRRGAQGMQVSDLAFGLREILALFIAGYASVSRPQLPASYLPFLVEPVGDRFVAFQPDRSAFLDAEHPFLTRIDGKALPEWLAAAARLIPKGSPQYVKRRGLRYLRLLQLFRQRMGLAMKDTVEVELTSRHGTSTRSLTLPVREDFPAYGSWPRPALEPQILAGNIGYLRLGAMNRAAVQAIRSWMPRFRQTAGLILDVRNNGGGSRLPLRELFPYFMDANEPPHVANVAAYRLYRGFPRDHLAARYAYRESSPLWSATEREAIHDFRQTFQPEWTPPPGELSEWHYMVISKGEADERYHYDQPVVILLDSKCFNATDVFLGAFKGWRSVTLVGTPSSGVNAFPQHFRLVHSNLQVRLASMASFQPTGELYDTRGIQPDVLVEPQPGYFLKGGHDDYLAKAIEILTPR